ncbi:nucleotidyltransferase family protein [Nonomuraea sp. NPDC004297]
MATTPSGGAEWRLLLGLCAGPRDGESWGDLLDGLLPDDPAWGELVEQALRHRMLALLAHALDEAGRWPDVPAQLGEHLRESLRLSAHRTALYRVVAAEVTGALRADGVRCAATKGMILESTVYAGAGERMLGDIDLMVAPADRERAAGVIRELGFTPAYVDKSAGRVRSFTRAQLIGYRLDPDHLPAFIRPTGDPVVPHVPLDVACSLTWSRCPYQVDTARALAEVDEQPVPGGRTVPAMTLPYHFLFTVLHLFREAWHPRWLELEQDVTLMKFADVARLWRRHAGPLRDGRLAALLDEYGLAPPVAWVLTHLDRVMGTGVAPSLGLSGRAAEEFLASAGAPAGGTRAWRGSMTERLRSRDRTDLFGGASP